MGEVGLLRENSEALIVSRRARVRILERRKRIVSFREARSTLEQFGFEFRLPCLLGDLDRVLSASAEVSLLLQLGRAVVEVEFGDWQTNHALSALQEARLGFAESRVHRRNFCS